MSPTIRIDDEVYRWLQERAVPFDDTPNSVLRRIAGLEDGKPAVRSRNDPNSDSIGRESKRRWSRQPLARGDVLIRKWRIPARQARFHRDGMFYELLTDFPAALCDCNGYVVFESSHDLEQFQQIRIGKKINVVGGVSSIPGYQRADEPVIWNEVGRKVN